MDHDPDDDREEMDGAASMGVRCCENGKIWFETFIDGAFAGSVGFPVEEAMKISDGLMTEIEKAIAIQTAQAGPFGHA